ncbi:MAG: YdeI/OmpD-associated family protein [Solirubrobacteraceae bacterium]
MDTKVKGAEPSYSQKQWFVLGIEGAKNAETRQRRIDKAVGMLREDRAQC